MFTQDPEVQTPAPTNRAQQFFSRAARSLHTRRNNTPPPIPLPVNPHSIAFRITPATPTNSPTPPPEAMTWATVELSNYPPQLTHKDVLALFQDFTISSDFNLPNVNNLAYPLRTFIEVAGKGEADRAVQELCWSKVDGRQINVKMVEKTHREEKEIAVEDLAVETKIRALDTARVYYPHLARKFLEVRECVQGMSNFAFLQARHPITVHSEPQMHTQPIENRAQWELVAAGRSEGWNWKMKEGSGRLAALKDLQDTVERQGGTRKLWEMWEGSIALDMGGRKI